MVRESVDAVLECLEGLLVHVLDVFVWSTHRIAHYPPGKPNVAQPIARSREVRRARALVRDASFRALQDATPIFLKIPGRAGRSVGDDRAAVLALGRRRRHVQSQTEQ